MIVFTVRSTELLTETLRDCSFLRNADRSLLLLIIFMMVNSIAYPAIIQAERSGPREANRKERLLSSLALL
jgi:hypothetical protein